MSLYRSLTTFVNGRSTQRAVHAGHLEADDAAADDQQAFRNRRQLERAGRIHDARVVRQIRQHDRFRTGRDNAVFKIDRLSVVETQSIRGLELRNSLKHAHFALLCHRRQAARQFADDLVLPVPQFLCVDLRLAEDHAVRGHGLRFVDDFGRVQQGFRGDTAHVKTHAAEDGPAFDQDNVHPEIRCTEGRRVAARACTNDDKLRRMRCIAPRMSCGHNFGRRHRPRLLDILGWLVDFLGGLVVGRRIDRHERTALGYAVADLDVNGNNGARLFRRNVHRRLVGLERNQRVLDRDHIAGRRQDLDNLDVLEVAKIRNRQLGGHQGIACSSLSTSASFSPRNVVKRTAWAPSMTR